LFLIALDLTKMQVDTNVSESDIGGIGEGRDATFTVDAYPGVPFSGTIRQVRLAPIAIQNVVTYNVVIGVDNKDLRLKPGMTANVSIVVAQRDNVLKVPNAALRFVPPKSEITSRPTEGMPIKEEATGHAIPGGGPPGRPMWKQGDTGEPVAVKVQTGISDGAYTEIVSDGVAAGDEVIVGIEQPRAARKTGDLPPGFGAPGGQRRSRDRGL
jgi:HlyD family secretion protein